MKAGKKRGITGEKLANAIKAEERAATAPSVAKEEKLKLPNVTPNQEQKEGPSSFLSCYEEWKDKLVGRVRIG